MTLNKYVKTHRLLELICTAVYNRFKVSVFGVALSGIDTEFIYELQTDTKLSKAKLAEMHLFIEGLEVGFLAN